MPSGRFRFRVEQPFPCANGSYCKKSFICSPFFDNSRLCAASIRNIRGRGSLRLRRVFRHALLPHVRRSPRPHAAARDLCPCFPQYVPPLNRYRRAPIRYVYPTCLKSRARVLTPVSSPRRERFCNGTVSAHRPATVMPALNFSASCATASQKPSTPNFVARHSEIWKDKRPARRRKIFMILPPPRLRIAQAAARIRCIEATVGNNIFHLRVRKFSRRANKPYPRAGNHASIEPCRCHASSIVLRTRKRCRRLKCGSQTYSEILYATLPLLALRTVPITVSPLRNSLFVIARPSPVGNARNQPISSHSFSCFAASKMQRTALRLRG